MKKRFLKNYETFKEESTNENTHYNYGFNSFQTTSEEEESSKKSDDDSKDCECGKGEKCECEKGTKESEEDTKEKCDCGKPDCDCSKEDASEESEEDTKENEVVVDADTDSESEESEEDVTDEEVDSSIAVDADDNGMQDITNSFNPLESTAREFSVAKIMTKNGAKIMMCYTCDAEDLSTLADNIDFQSACKMVETECEKNGLEKFDNANDVNLGGIPSFMMDKKTTDSESTSYRP